MLTDVRFDGQLVTGTARNGQRVVLRRSELVHQKVLSDNPRRKR